MQVLPLYYFTLVLTVMRTATVLENVCKKFQVFLMQSSFNFPPSSRVSRLRSAIANIVQLRNAAYFADGISLSVYQTKIVLSTF